MRHIGGYESARVFLVAGVGTAEGVNHRLLCSNDYVHSETSSPVIKIFSLYVDNWEQSCRNNRLFS